MRTYLLLASLTLLTACAVSSPSISHLRLSAGDLAAADGESPVVTINTVLLPDFLLRDELMHRDGEYRVRYDSSQRWAEPMDIGIQRVLAERLATRLNSRQVIRFPYLPERTADWVLDVEVKEFEADGSSVHLIAEAQLEGQNDTIIIQFDEAMVLPPAPTGSDTVSDGEAIAKAMSELLWQLADRLAQATAGTAQ